MWILGLAWAISVAWKQGIAPDLVVSSASLEWYDVLRVWGLGSFKKLNSFRLAPPRARGSALCRADLASKWQSSNLIWKVPISGDPL